MKGSQIVPSSLEEWLAYQTLQHPRAIDLGLERLGAVLQKLHWKQPAVPVITVAGTNGKGSVVATSAAILAAAGRRVGTFTSPHLRDYRERITIDGRRVTAQELVAAFERIEAARGELALTFFEYNTLAALLIFDAAKLDAWVLEVGMGGRLDAVNIVDADAAVVVSIGFDHQEYLGDTLEAIGREKAGVFRSGRAAILGSRSMPPVVAQTAVATGARLLRLGAEFDVVRHGLTWSYRGPRWQLDGLPPPVLYGAAQYDNAASAIAAVEAVGARIEVPAAAVGEGLRAVRLVGRFQRIEPRRPGQPLWILDVAHNRESAQVLAQNLRSLPAAGRTFAVCGILADKDAGAIIGSLRGLIDRWWFLGTPGERGLSAVDLAARVDRQLQAPAAACASLQDACAAALAAAGAQDRIVVFGSFHTVGPALDWLEAHGFLPSSRPNEYTAPPA